MPLSPCTNLKQQMDPFLQANLTSKPSYFPNQRIVHPLCARASKLGAPKPLNVLNRRKCTPTMVPLSPRMFQISRKCTPFVHVAADSVKATHLRDGYYIYAHIGRTSAQAPVIPAFLVLSLCLLWINLRYKSQYERGFVPLTLIWAVGAADRGFPHYAATGTTLNLDLGSACCLQRLSPFSSNRDHP